MSPQKAVAKGRLKVEADSFNENGIIGLSAQGAATISLDRRRILILFYEDGNAQVSNPGSGDDDNDDGGGDGNDGDFIKRLSRR